MKRLNAFVKAKSTHLNICDYASLLNIQCSVLLRKLHGSDVGGTLKTVSGTGTS